ncbi:MAG: FecR family protein [Saprospiraceae bacterium]
MKEEQLIELIHKKSTNALTSDERQMLNSLLENKENQLFAQQIEATWEKSLDYKQDFTPNVEFGLSKLKTRMKEEVTTSPKVVPLQNRRSWLRIAAAAAIIIVGGLFTFNQLNSDSGWQKVAVTDSTGNLTLVDGSKIAINSTSELDYPAKFSTEERRVKLNGEAFFDIAKNPEKPFIIESGDLIIRVLGTSFNVRNYGNEGMAEITVRSGRVEVSHKNGGFTKILEANDQLTFDKKRRKIRAVSKDANLNALGWWSGKLVFDNEKMSRVKLAIERTYNIELDFTKTEILNCPYTISNDVKSEGLEILLEVLETALALEKVNKVSDKKYQLVGGKCNF